MELKEIAVVILNWNGKKYLEKFLNNVIENSPEAEVIVADNDSSDDSVEFLKNKFPNIQLIQNKENGGYAKGYNDALKQLKHKYFVLLNSDIEVSDGWLKPMYDLLESDDKIAACQPKIKAYNQKDYFEYAGASGGYIDKFGYPFCRGRLFDNLEKDENQYDDIAEVFWATGAAMFVRKDKFWEVGGLDESFFAHMEEIDLCWRMKNLGNKIMIHPKSVIYHIGGGTLPKNSPFKTYLNFRNNLLLLHKNMLPYKFNRIILIKLILDGVAALKFLLSGQHKDTFAILRAHKDFYKRMYENKKKRPFGYTEKLTAVYKKSIVKDYYLLSKKKFSDLNSNDFS